MCHGWSASPAYLLPMFILGVRPIKEGYKEAVFHIPEIDAKLIDSVSGSVITPFGNIEAAWTNHNGFVKADVSVPLGVKLTVKYKEKEYLLKNGANTVYFKA